MNNVIDFISVKNKKQNEKLNRFFSRANSLKNPQEINKLVEEKRLVVEDHKLFLAFLAYLEEKQLEPFTVFYDVLSMPKHQFEHLYKMNWHSIVQLCFTFLVILKENNPNQYEKFLSMY